MDINGCCDKASKILRYPKEKLGCLRLPDGRDCFRNTCSILSHSKIQEIAQHPHGQAQVKGIGCRVSPVSPLILASHPIWNSHPNPFNWAEGLLPPLPKLLTTLLILCHAVRDALVPRKTRLRVKRHVDCDIVQIKEFCQYPHNLVGMCRSYYTFIR